LAHAAEARGAQQRQVTVRRRLVASAGGEVPEYHGNAAALVDGRSNRASSCAENARLRYVGEMAGNGVAVARVYNAEVFRLFVHPPSTYVSQAYGAHMAACACDEGLCGRELCARHVQHRGART